MNGAGYRLNEGTATGENDLQENESDKMNRKMNQKINLNQ
jgi:hypothetical protein